MLFQRRRDMAGQKDRGTLLERLVESPETVIWIHVLKRGNCNVFLSGDSTRSSAAILQPIDMLAEPTGFGSDALAMWRLLTQAKGWEWGLVDKRCASEVGQIVEDQLKTRVRYLDDIYHIPGRQVSDFRDS